MSKIQSLKSGLATIQVIKTMNISTIYRVLALSLCCLVCASTYAQNRPEYVPGQVLIKMKQGKSTNHKSALKTRMGAAKHRLLHNNIEVWHIDESKHKADIEQVIQQYCDHPDIEYIEPNYYYYPADAHYYESCMEDPQNTTPNDPDYALQWGLHNTGQTGGTADADIDAPEAWDIATGSPSVKVAVLDSGIDWTHEDLSENIWQNLGEDADGDGRVLEYSYYSDTWVLDPGDMNGIDDDGNGYVDDLIGWDFVNNDNNPSDTNGHGTHVAGVLGAKGDNDAGMSGVTWDVQMMPIRIFGESHNQGASTDAIISALDYAVSMGAQISNNSWSGNGRSQAMEDAIQEAANAGHLFITAAGNNCLNTDHSPSYPAGYDSDNIISVAAINQNDQLAPFSNYGANTVDVAAPGTAIWSSVPSEGFESITPQPDDDDDYISPIPSDGYDYLSGTSIATPYVSGTAALVWGRHYDKSYRDIKDAIINSAEATAALNGKCVANGRLNLYNTLNYFGELPLTPLDSLCRMSDSLALVAVLDANPNIGWDLTQPMDTWSGVTLSEAGCVSQLRFFHSNRVNTIPPEFGDLTGLTYLYIYDYSNNLKTLPPEFGNLTNLTYLDINSGLTSLPSEFGNLTNLTNLELNGNVLTTLPPEFGNLTNLTNLDLSYNNLMTLPPEIGNLNNLNNLYLYNNDLTSLPSEFGNLTNLTTLDLHSNDLIILPAEIGNLTSLTTLDLYENDLIILPAEIGNLNNLNNLYLYKNSLTTLPAEIGNLSNLETLIARNNSLMTLPTEISNLNNLIYLDLRYNNLTNLPAEVGNLTNLGTLDLRNNNLASLPPEIGNLSNLNHLFLSANNLTTLPAEIGNLTNLNNLYLDNNDLTTVVPEIGNLNNLRFLSLTSNSLTTLPAEIGNLNNLSNLHVESNNLTTLPPEIGNLTNLTDLRLINNNLTNLPTEIGNLTNLTYLYLNHNDIATLPPEIGNLNIGRLELGNNNLTNLPTEIGNLNNLWYINLESNQFGTIPAALGDITSSYFSLNFKNNAATGCFDYNLTNLCSKFSSWTSNEISVGNNFSATWVEFCNSGANICAIPTCRQDDSLTLVTLYNSMNGSNWTNTWTLTQPINTWNGITLNAWGCVEAIDLSENQLSGTIPPEIGNFSYLTSLNLGDNQITGAIPPEIANLIRLEELQIDNNQLTGNIPVGFGNLTHLSALNLSNNQLTDAIPSEIGEASNLTYLNLSDNTLSGSIPSEIGQLRRLNYLYLNNNALTGSIPYTLGNIRYLNVLALQHNQLTGNIPYTLTSLYRLDELRLHDNQLSGCFYTALSHLCTELDSAFNTNAYISDGNNFTTAWEDLCNDNTTNICEPVWAGDFNFDGTANEKDVLYWGLAHNNTGPPRENPWNIYFDETWYPEEAADWTQDVAGLNNKHQDGDGNGIIDTDDFDILRLNFERTHIFSSPPLIESTIIYRLERVGTPGGDMTYDLYIEDRTGAPVEAHGVSLTIDFGILPVLDIELDVSNSSLMPSDTFKLFNESENRLHLGLTRTDKTNQVCDAPIASFVVMTEFLLDNTEFEIRIENGNKITADATVADIIGTSIFDTPPLMTDPLNPLRATASAIHAQCTMYGMAWATASGGTPPYTYLWSTGETTESITQLNGGMYEVSVTDALGMSKAISLNIDDAYLPVYDSDGNLIPCNTILDIRMLLEGAYKPTSDTMKTSLLQLGVLPENRHPYHIAPWNYPGLEGSNWKLADYPDDAVDWVLVSLRTGTTSDTQIAQTAAILKKDGRLYFPQPIRSVSTVESVYIVIEHRNHLAIMTPDPIPINGNKLIYDFSVTDSYNIGGFGQKQTANGKWVMFAGDCAQTGDILGYDVNGADKALWDTYNGNFFIYHPTDMNLDGDVNGADKIPWSFNNGFSSAVRR